MQAPTSVVADIALLLELCVSADDNGIEPSGRHGRLKPLLAQGDFVQVQNPRDADAGALKPLLATQPDAFLRGRVDVRFSVFVVQPEG